MNAAEAYAAGLKALALEDPEEACRLLRLVHRIRLHPFAWAFEDYLSSREPSLYGPEDLQGVLCFGFRSKPDMPRCFALLSAARDAGRAGPFAIFLLGMLHLYHLEGVPYEPREAFGLIREAAGSGLRIALAWTARFCQNRRAPFFPARAIPRSIRGDQELSVEEIDGILGALSPAEQTDTPEWYDPEEGARIVSLHDVGWDGPALRHKAEWEINHGDPRTSLQCIHRGIVLDEAWAFAAFSAGFVGSVDSLFRVEPSKLASLRELLTRGASYRSILPLARRYEGCRAYVMEAADLLDAGNGVQRDAAAAGMIRRGPVDCERESGAARSGPVPEEDWWTE